MGQGTSYRANLTSVEKQTGRKPKDLEPKPLRPSLFAVFDWFSELRSMADYEDGRPIPIKHEDLYWFQQVRRVPLLDWQIDAILRLDQAYRRVVADSRERQEKFREAQRKKTAKNR